MTKSRRGVSIVRAGCRSMVVCAAVLAGMAGLLQARVVVPAGGGAFRGWSVPYAPASAGMVAGLQGRLKTETGASLLAQIPTLGIIARMSPDSEAHRWLVGAMALPAAFEGQLQAALQSSDHQGLAGALVTIMSAYQGQDAEGKIGEAVRIRADEIATMLNQGKMTVVELTAASLELAPFARISEKASELEKMTSMARAANTIEAAITG